MVELPLLLPSLCYAEGLERIASSVAMYNHVIFFIIGHQLRWFGFRQ